jgi:hypothetical protein
MNTFNDIKELVSALKREEKLISQMFVKPMKKLWINVAMLGMTP